MADNGGPQKLLHDPDREGELVFHLDWDEAEETVISYEWELQSRYLNLLEPYLAKTLQDWDQAIEQQAQQIDDEGERSEFYDFHSDEYHDHLGLRVILMNSFFQASFALFENQLMRICRRAQRNCGSPFSVRDLRSSSPTARAKKYLRKLGVEFPAETPKWQEITKYRQIRNKITHEGGILPPQEQIEDFAKAKQIVNPSGGNSNLELTRPFCDEAIKNFEQFMLEVHRAYVLWLKVSK